MPEQDKSDGRWKLVYVSEKVQLLPKSLRRKDMAKLRIKIYKAGQVKPEAVISIPLAVVRMAIKLVPKKARAALEDEGIDLSEIASLAEKQDVTGELVEVKRGTERIVVAVE